MICLKPGFAFGVMFFFGGLTGLTDSEYFRFLLGLTKSSFVDHYLGLLFWPNPSFCLLEAFSLSFSLGRLFEVKEIWFEPC